MVGTRSWCAVCRYPGRQKFLIGTAAVADGASQDEIRTRIWTLIDSILPMRPELLEMIPGALFFGGDLDEK